MKKALRPLFQYLTISFLLCAACSKDKVIERESNFDIILSLDNGSRIIQLKNGRFLDGIGADTREAIFTLDSAEIEKIFRSVPWEEVSKLPNYYNPVSTKISFSSGVYEMTIINGSLRKKIRFQDCTEYFGHEDFQKIENLCKALFFINSIVGEKPEVKKVARIRLEM